jgi:homoserine kinase
MRKRPASASVRVPASTSNLGGGFDCLGVAVDRWLTASVLVREDEHSPRVAMKRSGALANLDHAAEDDLVHVGYSLACKARGHTLPNNIEYEVSSTIPVARGLGASAAALVAGAFLARESLQLDLAAEDIATICAEDEGHPDNAGPAVFGGAVLGINSDDGAGRAYSFSPLRIHSDIALVFAVPELEIETADARAVLPKSLPFATAVAAVAKAAAIVEGLRTGNAQLLAYGLDDVVHVPFRRRLLPGYDAVVHAAVNAGAFGATLSGSGSTIVAVASTGAAPRVGEAMKAAWKAMGKTAEVIVGASSVKGASSP